MPQGFRSAVPPRWLALSTALALVALSAFACGGGKGKEATASAQQIGGEMILATTTSVQDSGLLDALLPLFEQQTGINVKAIAVGTGAALQMAQEGNADAVLSHAPDAEQELVQAGDVINRHLVAYNDFLIVGPQDDPAGLAGGHDAAAALAAIAASESRFVSRGDDSGTHKKELSLWKKAGIEPAGDWYQESGQGMGASLVIADQKGGYILTDRATYLVQRQNLDLVPLVEGDPALLNIYSVMQVNPKKGRINAAAAEAWVDFLLAPDTQQIIADFGRREFGQALFIPAAGKSEDEVKTEFQAAVRS